MRFSIQQDTYQETDAVAIPAKADSKAIMTTQQLGDIDGSPAETVACLLLWKQRLGFPRK
jgi:hypothetical protein